MSDHYEDVILVDPISQREVYVHQDYLVGYIQSSNQIDELRIDQIENIIETAISLDDLEAIRNRVNVTELLDFANELRKAGGTSNFLVDLIPSIPTDSSQCLIANALNFECEVNSNSEDWYMEIESTDYDTQALDIAKGINESLGLDYYANANEEEDVYSGEMIEDVYSVEIYLPYEIGLVAKAFDSYCDVELETFNAHNAD